MKKFVSLVLSLLMLMSLFSVSVFAEDDDSEVIGFEYTKRKETEHFILTANDCSGDGWYGGGESAGNIQNLTIKSKDKDIFITRIEAVIGYYGTLYDKVGVSKGKKREEGKVKLKDTIVHVDAINSTDFSFSGGTQYINFKDITVYYTKHYCVDGVCEGCGGKLTTGTLGNNISYTLISGDMVISGSGTISNNAFRGHNDINNVIIKEGITGIGDYAFYQCENLKAVSLPNTLETIGYSTFDYCSSLEKINIPNSVKSIGVYAFDECSALSEIEIPASVSFIDLMAFGYCHNLTATLHLTENTELDYEPFIEIKKLIVMVPEGWSGDRQESFGANSVEYINENNSAASTISEGNFWILAGIGAVAAVALAVIIAKKKKKVTE